MELSQSLTLDVSFWNPLMKWEHLEKFILVVIVHSVIIGQLQVGVDGVSSRRVQVMDCTLWHLV